MDCDKANLHPSTFINIPGWGSAEIDNELVPLITELNKMGLKTRQCCQGDKNCSKYISIDLKNLHVSVNPTNGPNGSLTIEWDRTTSASLET